jgi:hypothetical protein
MEYKYRNAVQLLFFRQNEFFGFLNSLPPSLAFTAKFLNQLFLFFVELFGHLDIRAHIQVSRPVAVQHLSCPCPLAEYRTRLRALGQPYISLFPQALAPAPHRPTTPARCSPSYLCTGRSLSFKKLMRSYGYIYPEVSIRPAALSGVALAAHGYYLPIIYAGRYI